MVSRKPLGTGAASPGVPVAVQSPSLHREISVLETDVSRYRSARRNLTIPARAPAAVALLSHAAARAERHFAVRHE